MSAFRRAPDAPEALAEPCVIVEVLSDSTEDFDRGRKLLGYRSVPSVSDVLLVSQHASVVEQLTRQADASWSLRTHGDDARIALAGIAVELEVRAIFAGLQG